MFGFWKTKIVFRLFQSFLTLIFICFKVRLTGAHFPGEGSVEVFYLGSWRPVCSDHWDLSDGHVACRELGLGTALDVDHGFISLEEMEDYILNDVRCNGSESRIVDCPGSTFSNDKCNSTRSARVRCSDGGELSFFGCNTGKECYTSVGCVYLALIGPPTEVIFSW